MQDNDKENLVRAVGNELIEFIEKSSSTYHVVEEVLAIGKKSGYKLLDIKTKWQLKKNGKYAISLNDTAVMLVNIGKNPLKQLKMSLAHTDFPCLKVKPNAVLQEGKYGKLNVEVYGGIIRQTWLDRPLSLAGAVCYQAKNSVIKKKLINFTEPLMIIPSQAIHINRKVNEGLELNQQKDLLPLLFMTGDNDCDTENYLLTLLAKRLNIAVEDILSYDLNLYPHQRGELLGINKEFLTAPRLDNLTSVWGAVQGLIGAGKKLDGINMVVLFDHEEVGSNTNVGAGSMTLPMLMERIYLSLGYDREEYLRCIMGGEGLSIDVAHALHPNAPEKADPSNRPVMGAGPAVKIVANKSYAGDIESVAKLEQLARQRHIPLQKFANRSDMVGGSTLGAILSTMLPMQVTDIGIPILAMHSSVETMGLADEYNLICLVEEFFVNH